LTSSIPTDQGQALERREGDKEQEETAAEKLEETGLIKAAVEAKANEAARKKRR